MSISDKDFSKDDTKRGNHLKRACQKNQTEKARKRDKLVPFLQRIGIVH